MGEGGMNKPHERRRILILSKAFLACGIIKSFRDLQFFNLSAELLQSQPCVLKSQPCFSQTLALRFSNLSATFSSFIFVHRDVRHPDVPKRGCLASPPLYGYSDTPVNHLNKLHLSASNVILFSPPLTVTHSR